jgi:glycosyltransferase involved in cell wall biosynthesis
VTDVSIDGLTALTCRPSDADDLVEKIQTLLKDRALAERLTQGARIHVMSRMTSAVIEARTRDAIEGAMIRGLV